VKFTTVTIKEIQADKTHRLDAGYWIKKKRKKPQAASFKQQAAGQELKDNVG